jgi:hypothetical protein
VHRSGTENLLGAVIEFVIEHGPFEAFGEALRSNFWSLCAFNLLPGFAHDRFVVIPGFFQAETFHLLLNRFNQIDNDIL